MIKFVSWDFRSPPTAEELARAIGSFAGGPVYAVSIDVGTDDYILALSDQTISTAKAVLAWTATD
jgi:hypothetical protein